MATPEGQCVWYAGEYYFGKRFGVMYARDVWTASTVKQLPTIQDGGCVAVWKGGPKGWGHVGVVEAWDGYKMNFSDCNRKDDEKYYRNTNITQGQLMDIMKKAVPSLTFVGYVKFK